MESPIKFRVESFGYTNKLGPYLPSPFDLLLRDKNDVEVITDSCGVRSALDGYAAGQIIHATVKKYGNRGLMIRPVCRE